VSKADFEEVLAAAKGRLHIEGVEILFSEDQGTPANKALVCVDRWMAFRDDAIRMQVRVLSRPSASADWDCVLEGDFSEPLTKEQAMSTLAHWIQLERETINRNTRYHAERAADVDAFGPRPRG
jgi:hypothetical protein